MDAQRERDGVHKVQSRGQLFAFGESRLTSHVRVNVLMTVTHSFPRLHVVLHTFMKLELCTETLKGCATTRDAVLASLTGLLS